MGRLREPAVAVQEGAAPALALAREEAAVAKLEPVEEEVEQVEGEPEPLVSSIIISYINSHQFLQFAAFFYVHHKY